MADDINKTAAPLENPVSNNKGNIGKENNNIKNVDISYLKVSIANDKMSASIVLLPIKEGKECSVDDIVGILKENNVKQGINRAKIEQIIKNKSYNLEHIIAKGKPVKHGKDGYFKYHFRTEISTTPKVLEDGSVDFKNMDLFEQVTIGQLITEYFVSTKGEFGFTVSGELITPKHGKDLPPLRGKGFQMSEDRLKYFSLMDGIISLINGRIEVSNMYVINQNVDALTGNINFNGDVHVRGNVLTGFSIQATGNIVIEGHVEASQIISGKSILLKKGNQGNGIGLLQAEECISGEFFESVKIRTKQDINANYLLNCDVYTEGNIVVAGKKGYIIGGITNACKGIICYRAGNIAEVPTYIQSGIEQRHMSLMQELEKQIKKVEYEIGVFEEGLEKIARVKEQSKKVITMKAKIQQACSIKIKEKEDSLVKKEDLLKMMKDIRRAKVTVKEITYPGVTICINASVFKVLEAVKDVIYASKENKIVMSQGK